MNKKAQGALEYLLLIGGAILVTTIVIILIINLSESTSNSANANTDLIFEENCPNGLLSTFCKCEGKRYATGYCCDDVYQTESCDGTTEPPTEPECGDGEITGDEDCEPEISITQTCEGLGFDSGTLNCNSTTCKFDSSNCTTAPSEECEPDTYYVDFTSGNDDNNGKCLETAWKTIGKVNDMTFEPGNSILFKSGETWSDELYFTSSGSSADPITIGSYGEGEKPVFDGQNSIESIIQINNASYVTIKNLEVKKNTNNAVLLANTNNCTVENLEVHDCTGFAGIVLVCTAPGKGKNNSIQNNEVYKIEYLQEDAEGSGIVIWVPGDDYSDNCGENTISGNTIHHNEHEGIIIFNGSNNLLKENKVYSNGQSGIRIAYTGDDTTTTMASGNIIEKNESFANAMEMDDRYGIDLIRVGNDNIVRYNLVHEQYDTLNDPGIPTDPTNHGKRYGSGGIRFDGGNWSEHDHMDSIGNKAYYNIIYTEYTGIDVFNFSNIELYNNTVYNSEGTAVAIATQNSIDNTTLKNHIIHMADSTGFTILTVGNIGSYTINNNYYYPTNYDAFNIDTHAYNFTSWKDATNQDSESLLGDPMLVNPYLKNFDLQSSSNAIDKGTNVVGLTRDYEGNTVPSGIAPDIGAYEAE